MLGDLQNLLSYIDEHYADNITLEYAASRMNFSNSHFSRTFKKLMGIHFVTYLNLVRVEQAAFAASEYREENHRRGSVLRLQQHSHLQPGLQGHHRYTPSEFLLLADPDVYKRTYYNRPLHGERVCGARFFNPCEKSSVKGGSAMPQHPTLIRKRLIPLETLRLERDVVVHRSDRLLVTRWTTIKPKKELHHGSSCFLLKEGWKVSRFIDHQGI